MKKLVTISREYGSGGRIIGKILADKLGVPFYDKEIIDMAVQESGFSREMIENAELKAKSSFAYNLASALNFSEGMSAGPLSVNEKLFLAQFQVIAEIGKTGEGVIVGRCADYILKDNPDTISVFCFSDLEERIRFSINEYDVPAKQAKKIVQEKDMKRARFYEFHTNQKWGDAKNYSLLINTSKMSTDEVVEIIAALYDKKAGLTTFKGAFQDQYIEHKSFKI